MENQTFSNPEESAQKLDELLAFQRETISEQRILEYSRPILEGMRHAVDTGCFPQNLIERLETAEKTVEALEQFELVVEDMASLSDVDEYTDLMNSLNHLAEVFAQFAVQKRIAKETRELLSKRAGLAETERSRALAQLERRGPKCSSGHPMTLRQGDDWFWGCTKFPTCRKTKELSEKELEVLDRY